VRRRNRFVLLSRSILRSGDRCVRVERSRRILSGKQLLQIRRWETGRIPRSIRTRPAGGCPRLGTTERRLINGSGGCPWLPSGFTWTWRSCHFHCSRRVGSRRLISQIPVGGGRTIDDLVADAWENLLFSRRPPFQGVPDSTDVGDVQSTPYGPDGYPDVQVDTGHDHNGAGDPHSHDWGRPGPGRPPTHADRGDARPYNPVTDPPPPKFCPRK